jgi:hypothetical protein
MSSPWNRDFRHPSPGELAKLMENARRERSIALAELLGFRKRKEKAEDERKAAIAPPIRIAHA